MRAVSVSPVSLSQAASVLARPAKPAWPPPAAVPQPIKEGEHVPMGQSREVLPEERI